MFAFLLPETGLDTMAIKNLGRWESLEMVQRYKRSVKFEDRLKRLYHDVKSIIRLLGLDTNH